MMLTCSGSRKRRRLDAAEEPEPPSSSWGSLHVDVMQIIADRVLTGDFLDYIRLRAVCSNWRACTPSPQGRGLTDKRFHPRKWMLFPEGDGLHPGHTALRNHVRFFNLSTGAFVRVRLPHFKNHSIIDSTDGILVLQRDEDTTVHLLHPFTGDMAELPPLASLIPEVNAIRQYFRNDQDKLSRLRRGLAAISVNAAGVITVILALVCISRVAFAKTGDLQWILGNWRVRQLHQALSFEGSIYVVDWTKTKIEAPCVLRIDPPVVTGDDGGSSSLPVLQPPRTIFTCPTKVIYLPRLVECESDLLLVGNSDRSRSGLLVIKLADMTLGKLAPLRTINDDTLFIARSRSLSISSKGFPSVAPNSIIFFDYLRDSYVQYHLDSDTWSPAYNRDIIHNHPPSPHKIIHHIMICCDRSYWNKALMFCRNKNSTWQVKHK